AGRPWLGTGRTCATFGPYRGRACGQRLYRRRALFRDRLRLLHPVVRSGFSHRLGPDLRRPEPAGRTPRGGLRRDLPRLTLSTRMKEKMMNRLVPALALALVVGTPVVAEDSNLHAVLSVLPDTVFSDLTPDIARYLDLSAMAEAHGGALGREALSRALLGGGIRPAEALALGSPESFAEKSGI